MAHCLAQHGISCSEMKIEMKNQKTRSQPSKKANLGGKKEDVSANGTLFSATWNFMFRNEDGDKEPKNKISTFQKSKLRGKKEDKKTTKTKQNLLKEKKKKKKHCNSSHCCECKRKHISRKQCNNSVLMLMIAHCLAWHKILMCKNEDKLLKKQE